MLSKAFDMNKSDGGKHWHFMDAYRKGLTGKALIWAVRKFRQHRCISEGALHAFETISSGIAPQ